MILEAIYNGEFYPSEKVVPTSPAYIEALKTCEKLMEQLSRRLSKEDYALVEELQTQSSIAQSKWRVTPAFPGNIGFFVWFSFCDIEILPL